MKKIKLLFGLLFLIIFSLQGNAQGTWSLVDSLSPAPEGGGMLLLTNGTVMCKTYSPAGWPSPDSGWMLLTPDIHGSYVHGTWSMLPHMHDGRFAFSSQVMPDGNVYVAGGEHGNGTGSAEIYNTITGIWTYIPGVPVGWNIWDANSELLYDGTVLEGCANPYSPTTDTNNLLYSPVTNSYTIAAYSLGSHEETSWVKLPDSSIMNVDVSSTNSERYIPRLHKWVEDATVPVQLYSPGDDETGAGFLLPNGKLFFLGDVQYTAIYTPSGNINPGTWTTGPMMPGLPLYGQLASWDGAAAMMPNGTILCVLSAASNEGPPFFFYEFNYLTNTFTQVNAPEGGTSIDAPLNMTTMLDLPDGTVLFSNTDSTRFYIYTPGSAPLAQGKPTISKIDDSKCPTYKITGTGFNGICEGAEYGDDWQMATNYPIVRLTKGTDVYYARTTHWNRLGAVMTGNLEDTAYFTLPAGLPAGTYSLVVTANGNPSNSVSFTPCNPQGIVEVKEQNSISVYPNPTNNTATISISGNAQFTATHCLELDDITGRKLKFIQFTGAQYELNARDLAKGLYFIRVYDKDNNVIGTSKIVVQ
jgi:hypothetical protein